MRRPPVRAVLALVAASLTWSRPAAADFDTYLALGDSIAFGETDFLQNPSDGNRGYVSQFAGHLARFNGGVVPKVVNLGVDGETTSTFFQYSGPEGLGPEPGKPAYGLNTNYAGLTGPTQYGLMGDVIAAEQAAGRTIGAVTIQLGANDLFVLASDPAFFAQSEADQAAAVGSLLLGTVGPNLAALVLELQARLPSATIVLLGYYDAFAPFVGAPDPFLDALARASGLAVPALNQTIAGVAQLTGARFIDIAPDFADTLALATNTHVLDPIPPYLPGPNIHPRQAGYDAIAARLQSVPEPGSLALVALGSAVGLLRLRRRRAA